MSIFGRRKRGADGADGASRGDRRVVEAARGNATGGEKRVVEAVMVGERLFCGELLDLPLTETAILAKCVEIYDDHEPCFIHRGAVRVRILEEIWARLPDTPGDGGVEADGDMADGVEAGDGGKTIGVECGEADFPAGARLRRVGQAE